MRKLWVLAMFLVVAGTFAAAQDDFPKAELTPEFEYIHISPPFGSVGNQSFNCLGAGGTFQYNLTRLIGIAGDLDYCKMTNLGSVFNPSGANVNANMFTYLFGPRFTVRRESRLEPFAEVLFGGDRLSLNCKAGAGVCQGLFPNGTSRNAFALTAGGGFDVKLNRRLALRAVDAEYMYTRFGNGCLAGVCPAGNQSQNSFRLTSGLVIGLGLPTLVTPSASCSVQPTDVYAGEPVSATANAMNFNPKRTLTYSWSATGGKISGKAATANVDTIGLAPGRYTASANVTDGKKGQASCQASFTVKERPKNPPQVSCSASPSSVMAGTPSTITCNCSSPDNAPDNPVSVSIGNWSASGGRISGSGNAATLDTTGAYAGPITVAATCTDSRGLSARGTASLNVQVPPAPPQASKLNEIAFKRNSARVDNTAKAILDDVALRLQRDADAHAVIVGFAETDELKPEKLAAERVANAKEYLVKEKGIDASRIEIRTGSGGGMKVDIWFVPAGASFNEAGTTVVSTPPTKAPYGRARKRKSAQ